MPAARAPAPGAAGGAGSQLLSTSALSAAVSAISASLTATTGSKRRRGGGGDTYSGSELASMSYETGGVTLESKVRGLCLKMVGVDLVGVPYCGTGGLGGARAGVGCAGDGGGA